MRLALSAAAGLVGVWYLLGAITRLAGGGSEDRGDGRTTERPFAEMVRGVRYVFLAIAAFAVGSAFVVSHPLPLIIGLIVATEPYRVSRASLATAPGWRSVRASAVVSAGRCPAPRGQRSTRSR